MSKVLREEQDHNVINVEDGDTLFSLAKTYYGDGNRWPELVKDNHGENVAKHAYVRAGTQIKVPKQFQPSQL